MRQKNRYKIVVALALVLAVTASLWFAGPVKALTVDVNNPPTGTLGIAYHFTVEVKVDDVDLLPITGAELYIYKSDNRPTYEARCDNLPLTTTITPYTRTSTQTASGTSPHGGAVSILATTTAGWGYDYGDRSGYGYMEEGGQGYHYFGYGYGYGSPYGGTTSIIYDVTWTPPLDWPSGQYKIQVRLKANSDYFTETSSEFTLSAPAGVGGGGGAMPGPVILTLEVDITGEVHEVPIGGDGELLGSVEGTTEAGDLTVTIPDGTIALDEYGNPLTEIEVVVDEDPVCPPPEEAYVIGLPYSFEPDGAIFTPPLVLTFNYEDAAISENVAEEDLALAYCDGATGEWVVIGGVVNTADNTITAFVDHFTTFAIIGFITPPAPAAFTVSDLIITPTEVDTGETVSIGVLITNTGDLTGSYEVILKIDEVVIATEEVTLAGGASQEVTFTTAKDVAGTYTVNINDLSGTFVVKAAPVPPTLITWWTIGGIIAGVIIIGSLIYFLAIRGKRKSRRRLIRRRA